MLSPWEGRGKHDNDYPKEPPRESGIGDDVLS